MNVTVAVTVAVTVSVTVTLPVTVTVSVTVTGSALFALLLQRIAERGPASTLAHVAECIMLLCCSSRLVRLAPALYVSEGKQKRDRAAVQRRNGLSIQSNYFRKNSRN